MDYHEGANFPGGMGLAFPFGRVSVTLPVCLVARAFAVPLWPEAVCIKRHERSVHAMVVMLDLFCIIIGN